jgi:hypothetical protein
MHAQIGFASRPADGHPVCADMCAVVPFSRGTLVCVADGLGHGPEARSTAELACGFARAHADEPLQTILRGMDAALSTTKGAAVSLLALLPQTRRALYAGVGTVVLRALSRARIAPPAAPGIVGCRMRSVRVWEYPIAEGDLLVLLTDGISARFDLDELARLTAQEAAEALLRRNHKPHDDACCVVTRMAGAG